MTISRIPAILGGLAVAALFVTPALAHRQGQTKTAKVGKSPGLAAASEEGKRRLTMANRAQRLLVLERDLDLAESLITQAIAGNWHSHWLHHMTHSKILEAQGRYEEAKVAYRPVVLSGKEQKEPSLPRASTFMHYALLCRKVGDQREESLALSHIPGDTLLEKATTAWKDANGQYQEREEIVFLNEIRRLDPEAAWVGPALTKAQKNADLRLANEKKRALAIENGINP